MHHFRYWSSLFHRTVQSLLVYTNFCLHRLFQFIPARKMRFWILKNIVVLGTLRVSFDFRCVSVLNNKILTYIVLYHNVFCVFACTFLFQDAVSKDNAVSVQVKELLQPKEVWILIKVKSWPVYFVDLNYYITNIFIAGVCTSLYSSRSSIESKGWQWSFWSIFNRQVGSTVI